MQQRQPRLGDVLDDYCPRERRLTNHAVVAMIGEEIKRTRCTTCDAEHEYKHAAIPRQRRKSEPAALAVPVAVAPKKVVHEPPGPPVEKPTEDAPSEMHGPRVAEPLRPAAAPAMMADADVDAGADAGDDREPAPAEEGPVHRTLIRAQLPRQEGQPPAPRPAPDFTIRQPTGGRPGRFRPRGPQRGGGSPFQNTRSFSPGDRSNGNFGGRGGNTARPQAPGSDRQGGRRHGGPNRNKRSK